MSAAFRMRRPSTLAVLLAMALTAGALTWLYLRARAVVPAVHQAYAERLRQLHDLDARVDGGLMAARLGQVRHYDDLSRDTGQLTLTAEQLLPPPGFLLPDDAASVAEASQALQARLQRKADLVDQFRRRNAVLLNSSRYFSTLTQAFLDRPGPPPARAWLRDRVNRYAREVMALGQPPEPALQAGVRPLDAAQAPPALAPQLAAIRRHGQVVAEQAPRLDQLMGEVAALQADRQIDALGERYAAAHARAQGRAERHQQALYGLGVLLLVLLGWQFMHLVRARRSLQLAHQEVSARYAAQLAAEQQLSLHATAFRNAHDGITLTDAQGRILDVNPAFSRITGWSREEVVGRNPRVLKSGCHDDGFYRAMWAAIGQTGQWSGEIWNRNKHGEIYPELLSISAVRDGGGTLTNFVAVFADIGHLKHQERQLKQLAFYDPLTELPNRKLLAERLASAITQARQEGQMLAVCLLDLDGFKPINDTWGHEAGDRVLVEIGQRLRDTLREGDTVARLGGDEFALLLCRLGSPAECEDVVQRLIAVVAQPLGMLPQPVSVSASVGVTLFPDDDEGPDTLLRHADQAMYGAKQAGKNGYRLFNAAADRSTRSLYHHAARLREALQRQELRLHYQPQVDMRRGVVVGAEALLRWAHPERGLLLPADFLPQVDDDALVQALGDWVIEQALVQLEAWQRTGWTLPVSVNVAGRHLQAAGFAPALRAALARHPAVAQQLELEVLETTALEDIVKTARVLDECRAMGVRFALDDFGAGYSSLSYLKRLPIESIKIDIGFVRELLTDADNLIIVRGVIGLARAFQRRVVAEGVESAAHGRMLLQLQCDLAQGQGIAPPMPAEALAGWAARWQPDPGWRALAALRWHEADLQLLDTEIRLRAWVDLVQRAIAEQQPVPPPPGRAPLASPFGAWLDEAGRRRHAARPLYAGVDAACRQLHAVVEAMDTAWREGRFEAMREQTDGLLAARDATLAQLLALQLAVAVPRHRQRSAATGERAR